MEQYSPFRKPLGEISGSDLICLRDIHEGWFVDYKESSVDPRSYGKHLSAFANQFGGWLFIGVKEEEGKSLRAGSFPGVPTSEVPKVLVQIREGVSAHITPTVVFAHHVIDGPVPEIGLEFEKSIIIVHVPSGHDAPYVHSSGRIYRRVGDSSEPLHMFDRADLDSLYRRSDRFKSRLSEFVLEPTLSASCSSGKAVYSHVYFLHDLSLETAAQKLSFRAFKEAMMGSLNEKYILTLDNIFPTQDGYIARHYMGYNSPDMDLISLRWWHNGNVRLTIPIECVKYADRWRAESNPHLETLRTYLAKGASQPEFGYRYDDVLDLGMWCYLLVALTQPYMSIRDHCSLQGPVHMKALFSNVRNGIPFVPMQCLVDQLSTCGVPPIQDNVVLVPTGTHPEAFVIQDDHRGVAPHMRAYLFTSVLAIRCLRALGIGIDEIKPETEEGRSLISDFMSGVHETAVAQIRFQGARG